MKESNPQPLGGIVGIYETYVGGVVRLCHGKDIEFAKK
jgi:hypothetical protein